MLAAPTIRACDALLSTAHTADQPSGTWHAKPQQVRRVTALKLQVAAGGGGADLRQLTCLVCFDDYPALKGVECAGGAGGAGAAGAVRSANERHFVCEECFGGHVASAVDADSLDLFRQRGGILCVHPGCRAAPFSDAALAKALREDTFGKYMDAKAKVAEQRINAELEAGFEERLQAERARAGGAQREAIKEHVVQKIFTLACPRCSQAFVDFNGCMALTCSRAGCGCGFCALCQEDCGGDAHGHVGRGCPLAKSIGVKPTEFHLPDAEYHTAMTRAKGRRLKEYLASLTEAQRQHALADCAMEMADLGLDPADFGVADANPRPRQLRRRH